MKKRNVQKRIEVCLGVEGVVCSKCRHTRIDEPYAVELHLDVRGVERSEFICWRCCRDAESTFMIAQKWPMAFDRLNLEGSYYLAWSPGVKELVGEHGKA